MTGKETRRKAIGQKILDTIMAPLIFLANHKAYLAFVLVVLALSGVMVAQRAAPFVARWQEAAASVGFLPDGNYEGVLNGQPVSFVIDRGQAVDDRLLWPVDMVYKDGSTAPCYLSYARSEFCFSPTKTSLSKRNDNVVTKALDGRYRVTAQYEQSPWLEFWAVK